MPHEAATQAALGTGCAATRWAPDVPPEALCGVPPIGTEALQMHVVTTSAWGQWARAMVVAARNSSSRRNLRDASHSN